MQESQKTFNHLKIHTQYSICEGAIKIDDLKNYCKDKLADFKIPKKIFFMEEIPKGATGKIQRIGMDKKLGIKSL